MNYGSPKNNSQSNKSFSTMPKTMPKHAFMHSTFFDNTWLDIVEVSIAKNRQNKSTNELSSDIKSPKAKL
jgi:hypothetical protein